MPMQKERVGKIEKILPLYYENRPLKELAVLCGWSPKYLQKSLSQYHKEFGTSPRSKKALLELQDNLEVLAELCKELPLKEVAKKFSINPARLRIELQKKGYWEKPAKDAVSLNNIKSLVGTNLSEPVLVTHKDRPIFYVIPLLENTDRHEEE